MQTDWEEEVKACLSIKSTVFFLSSAFFFPALPHSLGDSSHLSTRDSFLWLGISNVYFYLPFKKSPDH